MRPAASTATSTCAASIRWRSERLEHAIEQARAADLLGDDILSRGFRFDIEIRKGAGAYICGEETAIFNSIEGYRGEPRNKPPFPVERGAVRQPDGRQQRRDAGQRAADPARGRRRVRRASAPRARPARSCSASRARSSARHLRGARSGRRCGELLRDRRRGSRLAASCGRCCSAARPAASSRPSELDLPLTFEDTRARRDDAGLRRRRGDRR